jgi:selenocysteine-specific elongation factor
MVAGATGIDLFLFVVDAREGPRPQTHEHLRILRLLGIDRGVVAVTKADAVSAERAEVALEEARELVGVEAVAVSATTGSGLDELRAALARAASSVDPRAADGPTRLFVDRAFTLRGIGTIATGTLWSGSVGAGDVLSAEPHGLRVSVRSVEVHDEGVERAAAGQRVAVSVRRVEPRQLPRGTALVAPGAFEPTYRLDVALEELERAPSSVTVHHGSSETAARLRRRNGRAELRLAAPLVAAPGDRVLLRAGTTVGGGVVLERPTLRPEPAQIQRPAITRPPDGRVRLPNGHVVDETELEQARTLIVAECEREGTITLARARDVLGTSRRNAQAILERLDGEKVTLRVGDVRRLRRR